MDDEIARYRRVAGRIRAELLGPATRVLGEPEFLLRSRADSDLLFKVCGDYADFLESTYPKYVEALSSAYSAVDHPESTDLRQAVQEAARQGRMAIIDAIEDMNRELATITAAEPLDTGRVNRCGIQLMVSRAESKAATTKLASLVRLAGGR